MDLGVTDALDDLDADEDNARLKNRNDISEDKVLMQEKTDAEKVLFKPNRDISPEIKESLSSKEVSQSKFSNIIVFQQSKIDLREKIREKVSNHQKINIKRNQTIDNDDCAQEKKKRNRFQNERVSITSRLNYQIPDSLENIITLANERPHHWNYEKCDKNYKSGKYDKSRKDRDSNDRTETFDKKNFRGKISGRYDLHSSGR